MVPAGRDREASRSQLVLWAFWGLEGIALEFDAGIGELPVAGLGASFMNRSRHTGIDLEFPAAVPVTEMLLYTSMLLPLSVV